MSKIESERKYFRAQRMRELREEMGWSQAECGERSGIGQRRWADIEGGKYDNLSLATLCAIARALDVETYDELLVDRRLTGPATAPQTTAKKPSKGAKGTPKGKKPVPAV